MLESEEIITKQAAVIILTMTGTFISGTRLTRRKSVKKRDLPKQNNTVIKEVVVSLS